MPRRPWLDLFCLLLDGHALGGAPGAEEGIVRSLERGLDLGGGDLRAARLAPLLHLLDSAVLLEVHSLAVYPRRAARKLDHTMSAFGAISARESSGSAGTATSDQTAIASDATSDAASAATVVLRRRPKRKVASR
jgi:hypothetical protein